MDLLRKIEQEFIYCVAPMEDISDSAFRTLCYQNGADITFTEMTRIEGLAKKNAATWSRIKFHDETPTIIQLLPSKEQNIEKFLKMFEPQKGFAGFNFNLGCPSPDVINIGEGCAMIKRISKVKRFIQIMRDHNYPVSVKMRLGMNQFEKSKKTYLNMINGTDPDFFIVHARHGTQKYSDPADFSAYAECVKTEKIIIANGDISSKETVENLKDQGVKGVMIGRAAVANPAIFNQLRGIRQKTIEEIRNDYLALSKKYEGQEKYRNNVLKRLNSDLSADRNRLI